jgi:hypothetical protein
MTNYKGYGKFNHKGEKRLGNIALCVPLCVLTDGGRDIAKMAALFYTKGCFKISDLRDRFCVSGIL